MSLRSISLVKYPAMITEHINNYTDIQGLGFYCQRVSAEQWDTWISGPRGHVLARDIGWAPVEYYQQYPDRLWDLYLLVISVTSGFYHCCLSGKCSLYLDNCR